jgi:hypothetical protein
VRAGRKRYRCKLRLSQLPAARHGGPGLNLPYMSHLAEAPHSAKYLLLNDYYVPLGRYQVIYKGSKNVSTHIVT